MTQTLKIPKNKDIINIEITNKNLPLLFCINFNKDYNLSDLSDTLIFLQIHKLQNLTETILISTKLDRMQLE